MPAISIQLAPPLTDLNTPSTPSLVFSASAYMTAGLDGEIVKDVRPIKSAEGRPFVSCVHEAPPLVDLHMPLRLPRAAMVANSVPRVVGWNSTAWHREGALPTK